MDAHKSGKIGYGASLLSQGTKFHFEVAIVLVSIIPLLSLVYLYHLGSIEVNTTRSVTWVVLALQVFIMCLGCSLLAKYPRTIVRLRKYVESVAKGEVLDGVDLLAQESDMTAIQKYFNLILDQMRHRIARIEEQQEALIDAERQRVMTESLCTACHHLGQPATTIACYLQLLKREALSADGAENLQKCLGEADRLRDALDELQSVSTYRTEPYCAVPGAPEEASLGIIPVKGDRAANVSDLTQKTHRVLEMFEQAYTSMEGSHRNGAVVELNDQAICIVHKQNEGSPQSPVVEVILDGAGNHPCKPTMIDLMSADSLAIERTINAGDPLR